MHYSSSSSSQFRVGQLHGANFMNRQSQQNDRVLTLHINLMVVEFSEQMRSWMVYCGLIEVPLSCCQ